MVFAICPFFASWKTWIRATARISAPASYSRPLRAPAALGDVLIHWTTFDGSPSGKRGASIGMAHTLNMQLPTERVQYGVINNGAALRAKNTHRLAPSAESLRGSQACE